MKKIEELKYDKERLNKQKIHGITLIALVITIIILIILAGISLNFVLGDDSIISTAVYAREQNKIYAIQEELELKKGDLATQEEGKLDINKYLELIQEKGIIEESDIAQNHEESFDVTVENKYVFLVEKEENGNIKIEYLGKPGNITPKIEILETSTTTNSATIKFQLKYAKKYRILIKKQGESIYEEREETKVNNNEVSSLLENLEQGENYTIKIEAEAEKGAKAEKEQNITTKTIENLTTANCTFSYSPDSWTNQTVTATASTTVTGYILQTSKDGQKWYNQASQTFTENGTVYARLVDSSGQEGGSVTGNIDKIDKANPSATITISGDTTQTTLPASLSAKVTHTDVASGIKIDSCKYLLNTSNTELGTNASKYTGGTFNSNEEIITINPNSETKWYLHVLTVDNAGNPKETIKGPITIKVNTHTHVGDTVNGGDCYTFQSETKTCTIKSSTKTLTYDSNYYELLGKKLGDCNWCGGWHGIVYQETTYTHQNCGASSSTYIHQYCKTHSQYSASRGQKLGSSHTYEEEGYYLSCGKEEGEIINYTITY